MSDLRLRPVTDDDHEWLIELHNDPTVLVNMNDARPVTMEDHLKWWSGVKDSRHDERLVFCDGDTRIGFTKFIRMDFDNKNCLLGADIHKDHRGLRLAKPMWTLMLKRCFYFHNMHRVGLTTAEYNTVGQRVYRGLGFKVEGVITESLLRNGKYWDQQVMYLLKREWEWQNR